MSICFYYNWRMLTKSPIQINLSRSTLTLEDEPFQLFRLDSQKAAVGQCWNKIEHHGSLDKSKITILKESW